MCSALLLTSVMASGRGRGERLKRTTDTEIKLRRKKWAEDNPRIYLGFDIYGKWTAIKEKYNLKQDREVASMLIECWNQHKEKELEGRSVPGQSSTKAKHVHQMQIGVGLPSVSTPSGKQIPLQPVVSSFSESGTGSASSESCISGVEQLSREAELLSIYEHKAKATDKSFIEISLDASNVKADDKDPLYVYQEDIDTDSQDSVDLDLEMSLMVPEDFDIPESEMYASFADSVYNIGISDDDDNDVEDVVEEEELSDATEIDADFVKDKKVICFETAIIKLAKMNVSSVCQKKGCKEQINIKTRYVGSAIVLNWVCNSNHCMRTWSSQPKVKNVYVGDLLLSSSILTSGNNFQKIALLFKFLNLGCVSKSAHYRFQRAFIIPEIENMFNVMLNENIVRHKDHDVILLGDGRNDSPGHSAMYCTYTLMENTTKDIMALEIIDKRMVGMKSTNMEKKGLTMGLDKLIGDGINICEVTTDAHTQIAAMLRNEYPTIFHSWDVWHGAKNFCKKLTTVAQEKKNAPLREWIPDIINHFWYCSRKAEGDNDAMMDRWRGVLHHTTNVHSWVLSISPSVLPECEHEDLSDQQKSWLKPDGEPHLALAKCVLDKRFLNTLNHYVNFRHTGELENFHQHILMYAAKRFSYSYPMYKARNYLAAIDYQQHKDRGQALDKAGNPRFHRLYSKRKNTWSAVPVKIEKEYKYMDNLLSGILDRIRNHQGPIPKIFPLSDDDPRKIKRNIAVVSPPPTKELVAIKKSRFG